MYLNTIIDPYRRRDLMRAAERQRLVDFVTCCQQLGVVRVLRSGLQAVVARWQGQSSASATTCCTA